MWGGPKQRGETRLDVVVVMLVEDMVDEGGENERFSYVELAASSCLPGSLAWLPPAPAPALPCLSAVFGGGPCQAWRPALRKASPSTTEVCPPRLRLQHVNYLLLVNPTTTGNPSMPSMR